jgi:hypothetical protein
MRQQDLNSAALMLLGGALLLFCGALIHAISAWDDAATDRAYVAAATRAAEVERNGTLAREAGTTNLWIPAETALPRDFAPRSDVMRKGAR